MASADVTRRELSLGSQDTGTGWYAKSFTETTIQGSIQPRGVAILALPIGGMARYPHTFFTADVITLGDEIIDANGDYYEIKSADQYWWLNEFSHYQCELEKRSPYALRPTTSGTWHLDSDSLKTDSRYRHKFWLDSYITGENISGMTISCFSGADYPITQVFLTKDVDGIFSIDKRSAQQLTTYNHYPYAFIETVPITCYAVDKAGLTATNLLEQMEQEIRHVCSDHPLGSIRGIDSTEYKWTDIGGTKLWETTVTIRYKRMNDDYIPTYPRLTWGASTSPDGTFYFPNCLSIEYPDTIPTVDFLPPGRLGNVRQRMGDTSLTVKLRCDLDLDNTTYTWKRPQTTTPKTDSVNHEILLDIKHNAAYQTDEPYQTLTMSASGPSFKVTLDSFQIVEEAGMQVLEATFKEYNSSSASSAYTTRWGLT